MTVSDSDRDDTVYLSYLNVLEFVHTAALTKLRTKIISYFIVIVIKLLRLVFTSDGVVVGVVIRSVERHDLVRIKPTESEAEH